MKNVKTYLQHYIDWIIRIGKIRFSILGVIFLAGYALIIQAITTLLFTGNLYWQDIIRSVVFGLCSAPFAIYFFSAIIERLELARQDSEKTLMQLQILRAHDNQLNRELNEKNQQLSEEVRERERVQFELERSAQLLRSFFDASPDLVFYRGEDNRYRGANKAVERLTGKTEAELRHLTPMDIFDAENGEQARISDVEVRRNMQKVSYEQQLTYPDGQQACFEIVKVPYYDKASQQCLVIGFGRDITERLNYQAMIEKNSRDKTQMMTTISHELKTPLNGIIGLSRILLDGHLTEQQRDYLQTIKVSAVSLGHIFNDLVDLEKIETQRIELYEKRCDFNQLLNDINNIASVMAAQKQLQFTLELAPNLPDWILVDAIRLNQILWNVINNAVKFTQKGWVKLRVSQPDDNRLTFAISDSGIGIASSELDNIFAMYYQVRGNDNMRALGSGIGLNVAKTLAQLMQGDLTVESSLGIGTTFTLTILAPTLMPDMDETHLPQIEALRILLVEDIEVNIIVAKSILEKMGYHVDVAMTGAQALEKFEQDSYDLLLLDIQLPDMSGFDIAQTLRQRYENDEIDYLPPLVALTANVMGNKQYYLDQGMDDALAKPLSLEALNTTLHALFDGIASQATDTTKTHSQTEFDQHLLHQLLELLGKTQVLESLKLFERSMPSYIDELNAHYRRYLTDNTHKSAVGDSAHKIKGAAASIGLAQLRDVAELAQHCEREHWHEHIADWVQQMQHWRADLTRLYDWIEQQVKG
ncbi:aerobic respiration two-component sensor histidine kinase ArcB [Spirabiliibacterium falconis]|uniref:aerobic respiration two-component sensor histidine kinase ArcB n=1 Tax=Spirabiliibacterium falconis TaxID=572023 RepID=UPI001AADC999|nr:aerobic respiration two-component sensor histidine kinase ArcB [Spirabiliibacterium falconis]MBE2895047.1 aerobic respiration two-component sensor histidine kinase ArcB [Spirabiliibacterium falconis]